MGATVIRDVPAGVTVVGVPARALRRARESAPESPLSGQRQLDLAHRSIVGIRTSSAPRRVNDITVTQPFLPPLEEFRDYLEQIWANRWLTNAGPFCLQLENELARYLGVEHLSLFANGTIALVTALQALRIRGEVITTPYSFVATSHSLLWSNLEPVFADVEAATLNLDPVRVEEAISSRTAAILPVHVYGRPCDIERIASIARTHGLKVIYDAAHAFAVSAGGKTILDAGDVSVLSFHATKVFTTFEGGAIVCHDAEMKQRIDYLRNFGFADEVTVVAPGINGKMNEVQAAFGLLQLRYMPQILEGRKRVDAIYRAQLAGTEGLRIPPLPENSVQNFGYFPVFVERSYPLARDVLYQRLKDRGIHARRYFYPLITSFPMYRGLASADPHNVPVALTASEQVICLPIYPALQDSEVERVIEVIRNS
ncbi:MAG: DegT/DnrJ/EryC1/StrS family aminotransferase [Deltaproteobacteria bacterium]|nr:DegT/DnrJ/EryC1/StrS family aminotransferase [Deltaproteobacteria bacterium]